ncbi:C40 family peptidase [[Clostridium] innocuum]|uniref:NlpC/P60 family protein n=1 Tax=Clostridium innocuum TaxID=1522 RepID=UPI001C383366|nr:NlpC/P60 family protein [[Clostridium] innocuum]MBV3117945.1 C40 family peptidase [[Clostridium] innocuum]
MKTLIILSTVISCMGGQVLPAIPLRQEAPPVVSSVASIDSHIVVKNGKAYYMENGKVLMGLFSRNNKTYYAPEWDKGALKTGLQLVNGKKYYFDEVTYAQRTGIVEVSYGSNTQKHYFLSNGGIAMGLYTDNKGDTYYFAGTNGVLVYGLQNINGKKYYFDEKTGKQKVGLVTIDYGNGKQTHYFLKDGGVATGLYTDNKGDTYYFAGNNGIMAYGLQNINGKKYYFDEKTGKQKIGFVTINYEKGEQIHYFLKNGGIKQNGFEVIDGKKYYFAKDSGIMYKDIKIINDKKYYFHPKTGELLNGIYRANNGFTYYFDENTASGVRTGLQTYQGDTYLFHKESGIMLTGLFSVGKDLYCFDETSGKALKNTSYNLYHVIIQFNNKGIMMNHYIDDDYKDDVRPNIINKALDKIGVRYTTDPDGYVCSSFVTFAYENLGIDLWDYRAESFEQAMFVKNNNKEITREQLKPGDLIFWSKPNCGDPECDHTDQVHHIAIYLGNNKVIEANETFGLVDVQNITSDDNYVLYSYGNIIPQELESLEAPEKLEVTPGTNDKLNITWESNELADGYILYRKDPNETIYKQIAKITGNMNTSYADTATKRSLYSYKIASYKNVKGKEKVSEMSMAVDGMRLLDAANNLNAVPAGKNKVKISWDKVENAEGYIVYRRIGNGNFEYRYMVKGTEYTDTTASNSEYNYYRIYPYVTLNGKRQLGVAGNYVYQKGGLAAVNNLNAVPAGNNKVKISWDKVEDAEGYIVYRRIGNGNFEYRYMVKGTEYTDTTASNNEYNFYRVYPYITENGKRQLGVAGNYVYQKGGLAAANNLNAVPAGKNKVKISWDKVEDAEGYIVYRRIGNGNFEYRYMVKGTEYTDTTASNNEHNFYRVYPYITENGKRQLGVAGNYVYQKGGLAAVNNLNAVPAGKNKVKISWDKVEDAEGYIVYRRIGNGNFEYRYMIKGTEYTDTTASNNEYNFYRVYPYITEKGNRILGPSNMYKYAKGN